MKNKIDPKILIIVVLIIVLLYCGFRSLGSMAAASGYLTGSSSDQNPGTMERLLRDLDRTLVTATETDTSRACLELRDPFAVVDSKPPAKPVKPKKTASYSGSSRRTGPRVTGLILDQNPVAIVEIDDKSLEVRVGSLLEGHKVIGIDERGVHVLKNGDVVIIN